MPKKIPGIGVLYDKLEVCKILDISPATVQRHYRSGRLRGRRVGRKIYFLDQSIKEFLAGDEKSQRATSEF
jgi:predicted site-specific integrase-resolvase